MCGCTIEESCEKHKPKKQITEEDRWLDEELDFKERYEIPADKYIGWLSNI